MPKNMFIDTETCGLHGIPVLLQYAIEEDQPTLYNIWKERVSDIKEFLLWIAQHNIIGFNLVFDWFHIYKLYTLLHTLPCDDYRLDDYLDDPKLLIECEEAAIFHPKCLKPAGAFDVMLHAKKGPYQSLMDRKEIVIKRVPTAIATDLANELEKRVHFKDIYFARRKVKGPQWVVRNIIDYATGEVITPEFKNIVVDFKPSGALKTLAVDALGLDKVLLYRDAGVDPIYNPTELGYAPYAKAILDLKKWPKTKMPKNWHLPLRGTWPTMIDKHTAHWYYNDYGRQYAGDDVIYTRDLYKYFGCPDINDDDSTLAISVACCRWRRFEIDLEKVKNLKQEYVTQKVKVPTSGKACIEYIKAALNGDDLIQFESLGGSTKATILEELKTWQNDDGTQMEVAIRAEKMLEGRKQNKMIEFLDKLIIAKGLFASMKIIGALSGRMSGADDFNSQGIPSLDKIRECFLFKKPGYNLDGGDFDAFEVCIFLSVTDDPKLRDIVYNKKLKVHAVFGSFMFPELGYEGVLATDHTADDKYKRSKSGLFALIYGGNANTLVNRVGVTEKQAEEGYKSFLIEFPAVYEEAKRNMLDYGALAQPDGIGSKIYWKEPKQFVESKMGFKRYFTLEFQLAKALFDIAQKPPKHWKDIHLQVRRSDRLQTASGAAMSALYSAAFNIQSRVIRVAGNHKIQSTGAGITKRVQRRIWDLQPIGEYDWLVQPINEHDEIPTVTHPSVSEKVKEVVYHTIDELQSVVPNLKIKWKQDVSDWSKI